MLNISIDMGSSSVRMIKNKYSSNKIVSQEFHRFKTHKTISDNFICWDYQKIFNDIIIGLKKVNSHIDSIAIDAWGVDYAFIDANGEVMDKIITYRDQSSIVAWNKYFHLKDKDALQQQLFNHSGIMPSHINTFFQLYRDLIFRKNILYKAQHLLMIPDLFTYLLSGIINNEITINSTSGIMNVKTRKYITNIFPQDKVVCLENRTISKSSKILSNIKLKLAQNLNIGHPKIISISSHDTASALATLNLQANDAFLALGSWSVLGTLRDETIITNKCYINHFTNEISAFNQISILKNMNGLFLIQQLKKSYEEINGQKVEFKQISQLAKENKQFTTKIKIDDPIFASETNILANIDKYCDKTKQTKPKTLGEYAMTIYNELLDAYATAFNQLQDILGIFIKRLYLFGGGLKDKFLLELIQNKFNITIIKGEIEATSLGNALMQLYVMGAIKRQDFYNIKKEQKYDK